MAEIVPRPNSRSSTFRNDSGKHTYISVTCRMISGDEVKHWNGLGGLALDLRLMSSG